MVGSDLHSIRMPFRIEGEEPFLDDGEEDEPFVDFVFVDLVPFGEYLDAEDEADDEELVLDALDDNLVIFFGASKL